MRNREHQLLKIGFIKNVDQQCFSTYKYDVLWTVDFYKISDYNEIRWNILIDDLIFDLREVKKQYYDDLRVHPAYLFCAKENKKKILDLLNKYRADLEQVNHFKLDKTVNQELRIRLEAKVDILKEIILCG
jgi:hypothetical protein